MATATAQPASAHQVIVTALAEVIAVSIIAIIADSSETVGQVAVAIMAGWLLLFLMTNAGGNWLNWLTNKL